MNVIVVDNNQSVREQIVKCLQSLYPTALMIPFDDAMDAVRYGFNNDVDAVYTEINMRHITGFDVARLIRKKHSKVKVFFLSDTKKYLKLSIHNGADGYFLKPVDMQTFLCKNCISASTQPNKMKWRESKCQKE